MAGRDSRAGIGDGDAAGAVHRRDVAFLYLLLRLEDYALPGGSVGLFVTLALLMWVTRRVDWYNLRLGASGVEGNG